MEIKKESKLEEIEDFIEEMIGMVAKEKKTISAKLSKNYPVKEHAGKLVDLEIELLAIKKRFVPEISDEFIKKFKCKDIEQLKTLIRYSLENEKKNKAYDTMREEVLKQLVEKNPVDFLPEGVIEKQKEAIVSSIVNRLKNVSMSEKDIEQYKTEHKLEFQEKAKFMIHSSYLIYALARQLNISVSPQEVNSYLQNNKSQENIEYDKLEDFLIREKTLSHLIDTAIET